MPDDPAAGPLRIVMQRQYETIEYGPWSLLGRLRADGA